MLNKASIIVAAFLLAACSKNDGNFMTHEDSNIEDAMSYSVVDACGQGVNNATVTRSDRTGKSRLLLDKGTTIVHKNEGLTATVETEFKNQAHKFCTHGIMPQ